MKSIKHFIFIPLISLLIAGSNFTIKASTPDSAYIFAYSTAKSKGHSGLYFAWSLNQKTWHPIGPQHRFLFCDYGTWGAEKRLASPFLFLDNQHIWHCIWSVNEYDGVLAHAYSYDLIYWFPQSYPKMIEANNCLMPEVIFNKDKKIYEILWISNKNTQSTVYKTETRDFKTFTPAQSISAASRMNLRSEAIVSDENEIGTIHKVPWTTIDNLIKSSQLADYKRIIDSRSSKDDPQRFAGLKAIEATLNINIEQTKPISNKLIGVFFEDINYAADGGLYAELIQNRDFEYDLSDKKGSDKTWNNTKAWSVKNGEIEIDTVLPIHPNNKHYASLTISDKNFSISNEGFDGISIKKGEKYDFSVFARTPDGKNKNLLVRLVDNEGKIYGLTSINVHSPKWEKYKSIINASQSGSGLKLEIFVKKSGKLHLDLISLFPQNTFKNRKNGLRPDLAQSIADIHPRFVRFPGGCVSHGDGIANIYRWKNTIGPLESRKPMRNLWGYHQSMGLGYFEYFQFCEDIGAEPLPVIAAGVPCQNSSTGGAGQQGGIPMCEMDNYIQDILDLIEWANGSVNTRWGKIRAQAGHPQPFNLKYIGIGNEDLINDIFEERFTKIFKTIKEKHPEITVIGTVGPSAEGTDYVEGWKIANKLNVPIVDEHYYQPPGWFINNSDFYDKYERNKTRVYLGEYAAHLPGKPNNLETAISEAHYLISLERNGDVVSMASYAPLLAKEDHTQWNPDMIYFNNDEVKLTEGYYVQQLFGQNSGDFYVQNELKISNNDENVHKQIAASVVRESKSGDLILKLVNILPVEINAKIETNSVDKPLSAVKTVLAGKPQDKNIKPEVSSIAVNGNFNCQLPPYSLTIIRLKYK
jgi:alpha-L-arabinofuranosidase